MEKLTPKPLDPVPAPLPKPKLSAVARPQNRTTDRGGAAIVAIGGAIMAAVTVAGENVDLLRQLLDVLGVSPQLAGLIVGIVAAIYAAVTRPKVPPEQPETRAVLPPGALPPGALPLLLALLALAPSASAQTPILDATASTVTVSLPDGVRTMPRDLIAAARLSTWSDDYVALALYEAERTGTMPVVPAAADTALTGTLARLQSLLDRLREADAGNQEEIERLRASLAAAGRESDSLRTVITAQTAGLQTATQQIQALRGEVAAAGRERDAAIAARDAAIRERDAAIQERDRAIADSQDLREFAAAVIRMVELAYAVAPK